MHSGAETSCNSCHVGQRPVAKIGNHDFYHLSLNWGGTGDCVSCHQTSTWKSGQFAHDPMPNTCQECHQRQRPTALVGAPPFDHTMNGMGDCVGCHSKNTVAFDSLADWQGGEHMPTDLIGVRSLTLSAGLPTFSGTTVTRVTATSITLPLQMLHSSDQLPLGAIDSCVSCHTGALTGNLRPGTFHSTLGALTVAVSQPTQCLDCHSSANPLGFVGPLDSARSPASAKMRHEATVWLKDSTGQYVATNTPIVTQDCATCHKDPGGRFAGAQFHANLATQPSSCIACHANTRPPGDFGTPLFNHYTRGGVMECTTCHNVTNFASAAGWANGQFPHSAVTSCSSCHNSQRPNTTSGWIQTGWNATRSMMDYAKHGGTTDCYSCHSGTTSHNTMADWATGNFTHNPAPTDCLTCHNYPVGPVGASMTNHLTSFGPGQNCIACHTNASRFTAMADWQGAVAGAVPAGPVNGDMSKFAWTYWTVNPVTLVLNAGKVTGSTTTTGVKLPMQILHSSNQVPASMMNNCASCHTAGLSAASGTRFHTKISPQPTTNCASCHLPNGVPSGIVGPLPGSADMTVNMDHGAKLSTGQTIIQGQDCSSCHKNPGVKWNDANFHPNLSASTVTNCTSCHGVKMPQTVVASKVTYTSTTNQVFPQHFAHSSTFVTQDCVSCHQQKGLGPAQPWETNVRNFHSVVGTAGMTSCNSCHSPDKPAATVWYNATPSSKFVHSTTYNGNKDCYTCHTKKPTTNFMDLTKIGVTWAGGLYNHRDSNGAKVGSSTCATCHTPFVWGTPIYINGAARNCTDCHGSPEKTQSFFSHHKDGFGSKNTQRSACMSCHGTAPF